MRLTVLALTPIAALGRILQHKARHAREADRLWHAWSLVHLARDGFASQVPGRARRSRLMTRGREGWSRRRRRRHRYAGKVVVDLVE